MQVHPMTLAHLGSHLTHLQAAHAWTAEGIRVGFDEALQYHLGDSDVRYAHMQSECILLTGSLSRAALHPGKGHAIELRMTFDFLPLVARICCKTQPVISRNTSSC